MVEDLTVTAYVLINVSLGRAVDALHSIRDLKGVIEAHSVAGVFDIIAKVEVSDMKELQDLVVNKIQKIQDVESTTTLIVAE